MIVRPMSARATLSQEAYRVLRSSILRRFLPAGSKLVVRVLAQELGLSPTPVKQALAVLEREGLVSGVPHRGYFLPRFTPRDIQELYELREVVEGLSARLAAKSVDARAVTRLQKLVDRGRACVQSGDAEAYGDLDVAFHHLIREVAGNGRLIRTADAFEGQIRLLISTSVRVSGRLQSSFKEHTAIFRAIGSHLPEVAEQRMREHVRLAGNAVKLYLEGPGPPDRSRTGSAIAVRPTSR